MVDFVKSANREVTSVNLAASRGADCFVSSCYYDRPQFPSLFSLPPAQQALHHY